MKTLIHFKAFIGLVIAFALGACADMPPAVGTTNTASTAYSGYGVVQSIELTKLGNAGIAGTGVGVGTIAGGVVGGIVGNQVGGGQGNTAATVLGAAGGAYAGHELEKRMQQQPDGYKFTIRMDDGGLQTLTQTTNPDIRVGDRVRIEGGVVRRY